jgi:Na+-transporting NADH:ubiquinone oxidoreductase subunit NqrF
MPRGKKKITVDESNLTKGQLRKLNALRKSLGLDIADRAFAEWMATSPQETTNVSADKNADLIAESLMVLISKQGIQFPRGGYLVRRGRGRVIVETAGGRD